MNLERLYFYLYYKLYKVTLTGRVKALAGWYAILLIMILEVWLLLSFYNYYSIIFDDHKALKFASPIVLIPFIIIIAVNEIVFYNKEKRIAYVEQFERYPAERNKNGSLIVFLIVALLIGNLCFSFYLLGKHSWRQTSI